MKFQLICCAAIGMAVTACSGGGRGTTSTGTTAAGVPRPTIALVTHQAPGDTFWDLVRRGAEAAAAKDNIDLQYSHDPDAAHQADLVRAAANNKVAGIAATLAKPEVMAPAMQAASA